MFGAIALVAATRADRSARARHIAKMALAALFIGSGALVKVYYLLTGYRYADLAYPAHFAFVRNTWQTLVVPHAIIWIGLLIVFEAVVGLLILSGGRRAQVGLVAAIYRRKGQQRTRQLAIF